MSELALLRFYVEEWDRYTTGANYVNRLFTYLNRHWVKREKDEGRKGIYPVFTVSEHVARLPICAHYFTLACSSLSFNGRNTFSFT